jgi:hypothetical protein
MKINYRGFKLESKRDRCLGGWDQVYDTAVRIEDGWEMICRHSDDADTIRTHISTLKSNIDDYYEDPEDWEDDYKWDADTLRYAEFT